MLLKNQKLWKTENTKENQRTPKQLSVKPKNKGFRPTLGYGFVCFLYFLVSPMFLENQKNGNPKIPKKTKENKNNLRENQKNKVSKGFRPTLGYGFSVFPKVVLLFGFTECFFSFPKTFGLRENRKPKKQKKTYPRWAWNLWKNFGFRFYRKLLWFSLVFFCIFNFHKKWFSKSLRENQKIKKQTHIQGCIWNL